MHIHAWIAAHMHASIVAFLILAGLTYYGVGALAEHSLKVERLPEKGLAYTTENLKTLAANRTMASKYVFPVLVPLDLLVMILLAASMALGSAFWARSMGLPPEAIWIVLLLPAAYVAADLIEDSMLVVMLTYQETINDAFVGWMKVFTVIKMGSVLGAGAQTLGFLILALGKCAWAWVRGS
jgi:hypothetical protein